MKVRVYSEKFSRWIEIEVGEAVIAESLLGLISLEENKEQESNKFNEVAKMSGENEKFLKPEEVAERLSLSSDQVLEFAKKGIIPYIRYNARVIRFAESDLLEFIRTGRGK